MFHIQATPAFHLENIFLIVAMAYKPILLRGFFPGTYGKKISNFPPQQRDHNHRYTAPIRNQLQKLYPHSKSNLFFRYTLPGHQHFSRFAMPALYNELVKQVKCELLGAKWFATTTDMWMSRSTIRNRYTTN